MKLIAVDLDGTLLGGTSGRYGLLPAGVEALRRAAGQGKTIAVATGRELPFILGLLEREGIVPEREGWPQLIISEERFIHRLNGQGEYAPEAEWNEAIERAEREHFGAVIAGVAALLEGELASVDAASRRCESGKEEARGFVEVLFTHADAARAGEAVIADWLAQSGLPYSAVRNVAGVAIRRLGAGKGPVLARACELLRIAPEQALAIGDSCNDLSMLDGGHGFAAAAPGNAEEEVKARLRASRGYIAAGNCGNGVAEAVYAMLPELRE
ncbi:Cof-type HAD-IIB family hydrolase [Paenibacillus doosanensis]|uniref:Phosphoglycolate phosphatase n=1 Tax=Paenibacillus konkukensis TaxID=2020716 RepID=A0ABY4RV19_9BACL|nr:MULTISPECIES: HAD family hydrolase [Paenibacillus]MCS7464215.1 Cof-type HAD-IIB family hydrolase [Paenibacillus doosanensis]UQZ85594.1 phosphoglycolate phosphatase [Paenibacillus konkukensis]